MSTAEQVRAASRNGTPANTTIEPNANLTEAALDQVIEDSFPASDPPSHTPLTSLGPPKGQTDDCVEEAASRWGRRLLVAGGVGVGLLLGAVVIIARFSQRNNRTGGPFARSRRAYKDLR